jgi:dCTP deaminase
MILNDRQIIERVKTQNMIEPFEANKMRMVNDIPAMSFGLGHFGYDLRLSPNDFRIFRHIPGTVIDPKNFNPKNIESVSLKQDSTGSYFLVPGHSYGLGVAIEKLNLPDDITTICMGKSSYARAGLIANITPGEAGWKGNLTLEFSNSSPCDCKIYANEGVVQLLFLKGDACSNNYGEGKYQGQTEEVTLARI